MKNPKGSVLLLSLLILSAVLAATTVVASFIVREVRSNRQLDNALLAFYASESGIEEGLWRASVDPEDPVLLKERTATFEANTATVKRLGKNRGKSISYPFLARGETFTFDLYNPDSGARDAGNFAAGVAMLTIEATGQLTLSSCQERAATGGLVPCDEITTDQPYTSLSLNPTKAYRLAWKAGSEDVRDISFSGTGDGGSVDLSTPLTIESTGALTTIRQALRVTLVTPSPLSGIPGGVGGEGGGEGGGGGGGGNGSIFPDTSVLTFTWRNLQDQQVNTLSSPAVNEWWVAPRSSSDSTDLFYTNNGGKTWQRRPEDTGLNLHNVIGVHFFDSSNGMAIGTTLQGVGRLIWTDDGGKHWTQSNLNFEFTGTGSGVFAVPLHTRLSSVGWFGGGEGKIARTDDRGQTWNLQTTPTTKNIKTMMFYDENHGFATTTSELLRTTNGGATWESLPMPLSTAYSITFGSPQVGWAAYGGSRVYFTNDGGRTWTQQEVGAGNIYALHAFDADHVLAVRRDGAIRQTTDGGQTWSTPTVRHVGRPEDPPTVPFFRTVIFRNAREGWILGDNGIIIHVTPGAP